MEIQKENNSHNVKRKPINIQLIYSYVYNGHEVVWWTWCTKCKILVKLDGLLGFEKRSFFFFGMSCMCLRVQECERLGEEEMEVWNKCDKGMKYLLNGSTSLFPSLFNVCSSISIFMSVSKYMNRSIEVYE